MPMGGIVQGLWKLVLDDVFDELYFCGVGGLFLLGDNVFL
jgi:hypothetical protein